MLVDCGSLLQSEGQRLLVRIAASMRRRQLNLHRAGIVGKSQNVSVDGAGAADHRPLIAGVAPVGVGLRSRRGPRAIYLVIGGVADGNLGVGGIKSSAYVCMVQSDSICSKTGRERGVGNRAGTRVRRACNKRGTVIGVVTIIFPIIIIII